MSATLVDLRGPGNSAKPSDEVDGSHSFIPQDPVTEPLARGFIPRWASRGISMAVNVVLTGQVMFYATTTLGLSPQLLGTLFLAANLFDWLIDFLAGALIDRTRTRLGKARPYELFIIPLWLLTIALFSTPLSWSQGARTAFLFGMFVAIASFCRTFLGMGEIVFLKRAVPQANQVAQLTSRNGIFVVLVAAGANLALPQLVATFAERPNGWTIIAVIYAIPMMALGLVRFFTIPEVANTDLDTERISARQGLSSALRNRYVYVVAGLVLCARIATTVTQMTGLFFFTFVIGDVRLMSLVMISGLAMPVGLLLFPRFQRRFGAINYIRVTLIVSVMGFGVTLLAPHNVAVVAVGQLFGALIYSAAMLGGYFMIQTMTYGHWKTGVSADGSTNALVGAAGKIAGGIATAVIGGVLGTHGLGTNYSVGGAEVQSALITLYAVVPLVLAAIMFVITLFWDLDSKMPAIQQDLAAGRTAIVL